MQAFSSQGNAGVFVGANPQVEPHLDMSEADRCSHTSFVGSVKRVHLTTSLLAQVMAKGLENPLGPGPRTGVKETPICLSERDI